MIRKMRPNKIVFKMKCFYVKFTPVFITKLCGSRPYMTLDTRWLSQILADHFVRPHIKIIDMTLPGRPYPPQNWGSASASRFFKTTAGPPPQCLEVTSLHLCSYVILWWIIVLVSHTLSGAGAQDCTSISSYSVTQLLGAAATGRPTGICGSGEGALWATVAKRQKTATWKSTKCDF